MNRRVYGPPAWRVFLDQVGCLVCGYSPVQLAHVRTGGMGRKADWTYTVPLCHTHHREQHQHGVKTFQAKYGLDLTAAAARLQAAFASTGTSGRAG